MSNEVIGTDNQGDVFNPHRWFMRKAILLARRAAEAGEVPVGAVIVHENRLVAQAWNQVEMLKDATAHAEMIAITQAASALGDWRLTDTVLYVTKEPCPMCSGAIVLSRIPLVVWGMTDPLRGGAVSKFNILQSDSLNHRVECITGILEDECKEVMQDFFRKRREEAQREHIVEQIEQLNPQPGSNNQTN